MLQSSSSRWLNIILGKRIKDTVAYFEKKVWFICEAGSKNTMKFSKSEALHGFRTEGSAVPSPLLRSQLTQSWKLSLSDMSFVNVKDSIHVDTQWSLENRNDNFMTQEVGNSTEKDAVSDIVLADREKCTQNVKVLGNCGMGTISSTVLA